MYVKKINYFVFIIHRVNNHGVSSWWFSETDVKPNILRVSHCEES